MTEGGIAKHMMKRLTEAEELDPNEHRLEYRQAQLAFANNNCARVFAEDMAKKLKEASDNGRHGWQNPDVCSIADLRRMFDEQCLRAHPDFIDVANFAMMLFFRTRGLRGYDPEVEICRT